MTNQTTVITNNLAPGSIISFINAINGFITGGYALGYYNFEIKQIVVTPQVTTAGTTGTFNYTVQINYYDPSIHG